MNGILRVALGLSLVTWPASAERKAEESPVSVPAAVAAQVTVILDAQVAVQRAHKAGLSTKQLEFRLEELVGKLTTDKTPAADEALVVVTQFYIGEATSEDIDREIKKRGGRMLPYLRKYRRGLAQIPGRNYPDSIRLDPQTWKGNIDADIESIQHGKVRFED
jgi:hypothetical protein